MNELMKIVLVMTGILVVPKIDAYKGSFARLTWLFALMLYITGNGIYMVGVEAASTSSAAYVGKSCHIALIADHHYVSETGSVKTIENMVNNINLADIFYSELFGFRVKPLTLIKIDNSTRSTTTATTTTSPSAFDKYFIEKMDGKVSENIDSFLTGLQDIVKSGILADSGLINNDIPVCAVILLTAQNFGTNLGISENSGVCRSIESGRATGVVNVILSGERISQKGEVATFLHELGHIFGSQHDKSPGFLMDPIVSDTNKNLFHLSPTSTKAIQTTLLGQSGQCFI